MFESPHDPSLRGVEGVMGKVQQCRNGCNKLITVQLDDGKYKPFEVDLSGNPTQLHNCPNSEYNKQQGQGGQVTRTQQPQVATDKPSLEAILLNQISQSITEGKNINTTNHVAFAEKLELINEIVKNSNIMLDAIVAHLKLTEPRKASEIYQPLLSPEDKAEREKAEIQGWNSKEKEQNQNVEARD